MLIAIHTKYLGPTNTRGSRIRASMHRGTDNGKPAIYSVTMPYDYAGDAHLSAARALRDQYFPDLTVRLVGATIDGKGDVFTLTK